jgi:hypothetical protein
MMFDGRSEKSNINHHTSNFNPASFLLASFVIDVKTQNLASLPGMR